MNAVSGYFSTNHALHVVDNDVTAGPPPRMPDGVKPLCGYVHPDDAKKWMMYELIPGSGVYIHQENYNVVLSKTRQDRPDGKAMARYLMSCFWRQSELVGASIAEPPKPHQKSLDRGIIHAILGFCTHQSRELPTDIRRTIQQKIGYAKFYFVKKTHDPDSPKTPALIAAEASPRRMSIEMSRRNSAGIPMEAPPILQQLTTQGKRGRRASEVILYPTYRTAEDIRIGLPPRNGSPEIQRPASASSSIDLAVDPRLSIDEIHGTAGGRLAPSPSSLTAAAVAAEMSGRSTDMGEPLDDNRSPIQHPTDMSNSNLNRSSSSEMISPRALHQPRDGASGSFPSRMISEITSRMAHPNERMMEHPSLMVSSLSSEMVGRMSAEDATSSSDLLNRVSTSMGSVPAGMSRSFLDMLNNYPNN